MPVVGTMITRTTATVTLRVEFSDGEVTEVTEIVPETQTLSPSKAGPDFDRLLDVAKSRVLDRVGYAGPYDDLMKRAELLIRRVENGSDNRDAYDRNQEAAALIHGLDDLDLSALDQVQSARTMKMRLSRAVFGIDPEE